MRDFSFLFYPGDVLRDVQFFSKAQKGCYLEALTSHLEHPRFSKKTLLKITIELNETERNEFLEIFSADDDGYYLSWADTAIEKRSAYLQSRIKNRKGKTKKEKQFTVVGAAGDQRDAAAVPAQQPISKTYVFDMENENKKENKYENRNETKYKNETEKKSPEIRKMQPDKQPEQKPESPLRAQMREQFLKSYERKKHIAFAWDLRHNLHLDEIIPKIQAVAKASDEAAVLKFWDTLIENLPDWYFTNGFSPTTINTKFNEIVAKIHKPAAVNNTQLQHQLEEIAAAGNPYAPQNRT